MRTALFIIVSVLFMSTYHAQNTLLNQKDAKGKQHGKWKLWLDATMRSVPDSSKATYWRYTYFDHGENLYPMGGIDKKWKMDPASGSLKQKGKIKLLDGENKWYDEKGVLKSYQKFDKGEAKLIQFFWEEKSAESWDYTKKWEEQAHSWFATISDKNGKAIYYYQRFAAGKWQMFNETDSTRTFEITIRKTSGDSSFVTVKTYLKGKLNAENEKIFFSCAGCEWKPALMHGHSVEYRATGLKENEGDFYYGKRKGPWKFWDENGTEKTVNY